MEKNLFLKIDDDVSRALLKISHESADDLVLVLPKESWLLADIGNLELLKKQAQTRGKNISIFSMDKAGMENVRAAGIKIRGREVLQNKGVSVDVILKKKKMPRWQQMYPERKSGGPVSGYQPLPSFSAAKNETAAVKILPTDPEKQARVADQLTGTPSSKKVLMPEKRQPPHYRPKVSHRKSAVFLLVTFILAVLFVGLVILPEADLVVYAHNQILSRDVQVNVDKSVKQPSSKELTLPAQLFEKEQSVSQQFNASGKQNVGLTAKGYTQIYNFTGKTLKLGAATTKLVVGKKIFRLDKDLSGIRATKKFANGEVDKSTLIPEVLIIADQPGEEYNLPSGTRIEIENDILGSVPQLLYSQNTQAISGGVTRLTNIVSEADITDASKKLSDQVLAAAKQQLFNAAGLVLLDSGANMQIKDIYFDKKAGDAALNFNGTISAKISALVYKQSDLVKLLRERISLTLDKGKYLAADDSASYKSDYKSADLNLGVGILAVNYQGKVLSELNSQEVEAKIRGKSPEEVKQILLSNPDIDGLDLTLKPFWVRAVPKITGKVYVTIQAK